MKKFLCFLFSISVIAAGAADMQKYIRHSGGNYLGANKQMKAVLKSPNAASPLFTIAQQSDGSYSLSFDNDGTVVYLTAGSDNNAVFTFQTTYNASLCRFKLEQVDGMFYRFKSEKTGKYLGVQNVLSGNLVYGNTPGNTSMSYWLLNDEDTHEEIAGQCDYFVFPAQRLQPNEGSGVSLCFWANMCGKELWNDYYLDKIIDWLVSPDGLNINLFRYNIGGGDDPNWTNCPEHHFVTTGKGARAEIEGFKVTENSDYDWSRDASQRRVMLKIKEKRPDAIFEAFSNSAPWWMTVSGCCAGGPTVKDDNLKPEYYEAFAHYLVDVCKHYKDTYGIEFRTLEPFNEPQAEYWAVGLSQEGCHFSTSSQGNFLKVLYPILQESGLNTKISTSDETSILHAITDIKKFNKNEISSMIGQWNTHSYITTDRARSQYGNLARATGCPVWMSEYGPMDIGTGITGNLAIMQHKFMDIHYLMPDAWFDWQYMDYNDQWGTISCSFENPQNVSRLKNYYVHSQVSRFIKAGYYFVPSTSLQSIAAISPDGSELVIVALNEQSYKTVHTITLPLATIGDGITATITSSDKDVSDNVQYELVGDNKIRLTLEPISIATLVIPLSEIQESDEIVSGDKFIIVPQTAHSMAVAADGSSLVINDINTSDASQVWSVEKTTLGFTFTNGENRVITYDNSLAVGDSGAASFSIEGVSDYFYAINNGTKGFGLTSNGLSAGTKLMMGYDTDDPEQDTRHWLMLKVHSGNGASVESITGDEPDIDATPEYYDILGRRYTTPQPGLNIVRQGKTTRKIIK